MVHASDFKLFSVQASAFTPGCSDKFRTSVVLASILGQFAKRYDGEVESSAPLAAASQPRLDVPAGRLAPIQLTIGGPAVTLCSRDSQWKLESGPSRTDSYWIATAESHYGRDDLAAIMTECLAALLVYPVATELPIGRMALVVRRWAPIERPAAALARRFCLPRLVDEENSNAPLRRSRTFRLDNLKRYFAEPIGWEVNSWVRCFSTVTREMDSIAVDQDINTLAEQAATTAFCQEDVRRFFDWVPGEMNHILDLYFGLDE